MQNTNQSYEKNKIELLTTGKTSFVYDVFLFYVENGTEHDYVYDIYSPKGEIANQSPIDGGMFDGTIDDLFDFMTTGNEHLKELL